MAATQVYIIHGYMASTEAHWFQWLCSKLEEQGINTRVLAMPTPDAPEPAAWQTRLKEELTGLNPHSYVVAHSLGCIALLHYLQQQTPALRIGGAVLVAGFAESLPSLPQLNHFISPPVISDLLIDMLPQRAVFASPQDPIVPYSLSEKVAQQLDAKLYPIEHAGHFLSSDGYTRFPALYDVLLRMINRGA